MISASEVISTLKIPRVSFYRALPQGRIPFHEERPLWRKRPVRRFRLSEVRKALGMDVPRPPAPPASE